MFKQIYNKKKKRKNNLNHGGAAGTLRTGHYGIECARRGHWQCDESANDDSRRWARVIRAHPVIPTTNRTNRGRGNNSTPCTLLSFRGQKSPSRQQILTRPKRN